MPKSDTRQDIELACGAVAGRPARTSNLQRLRCRLSGLAGRISTCALGIAMLSMVMAQNVYGQTGGRFKAVPKADDDAGLDMIFGIPANTLFFAAVGVFALYWFTLGGGRKAKINKKK